MSAKSSISTSSSATENPKVTCVLVETASGDSTGRRMLASEELVQHSEALQTCSRCYAGYAEFFVPQSDTYDFDHINVISGYLELKKALDNRSISGRSDDTVSGLVTLLKEFAFALERGRNGRATITIKPTMELDLMPSER